MYKRNSPYDKPESKRRDLATDDDDSNNKGARFAALNKSMYAVVKKNMEASDVVNFVPCFEDYLKHAKEINESAGSGKKPVATSPGSFAFEKAKGVQSNSLINKSVPSFGNPNRLAEMKKLSPEKKEEAKSTPAFAGFGKPANSPSSSGAAPKFGVPAASSDAPKTVSFGGFSAKVPEKKDGESSATPAFGGFSSMKPPDNKTSAFTGFTKTASDKTATSTTTASSSSTTTTASTFGVFGTSDSKKPNPFAPFSNLTRDADGAKNLQAFSSSITPTTSVSFGKLPPATTMPTSASSADADATSDETPEAPKGDDEIITVGEDDEKNLLCYKVKVFLYSKGSEDKFSWNEIGLGYLRVNEFEKGDDESRIGKRRLYFRSNIGTKRVVFSSFTSENLQPKLIKNVKKGTASVSVFVAEQVQKKVEIKKYMISCKNDETSKEKNAADAEKLYNLLEESIKKNEKK